MVTSALGLLIQIYSCPCILFLVIAVNRISNYSCSHKRRKARPKSIRNISVRPVKIVIGYRSNDVGVAPLNSQLCSSRRLILIGFFMQILFICQPKLYRPHPSIFPSYIRNIHFLPHLYNHQVNQIINMKFSTALPIVLLYSSCCAALETPQKFVQSHTPAHKRTR